MRTILHLSCSPRGHHAASREASELLLAALRQRDPDARVVLRDLAAEPPGLVDAGFSAAILSADLQSDALAESEVLILELEAADVLVIATPMHNYGVPAALKAWVDQVVRIHRTFRSTPAGKIGLLAPRPVYVVVASGGWFTAASPTGAPPQPDFLTPYLRKVLGTIGLGDVRFIILEGIARGTDHRERAMAAARAEIAVLTSGT
jgi:FMN-dependent NADH-azoreductase